MGRNEMSCRIHYTPSRPVDIGIATLTKIQIEHTNTQPFSTRMSSGCIWLRSRWLRISQSLDTKTQTHYKPSPRITRRRTPPDDWSKELCWKSSLMETELGTIRHCGNGQAPVLEKEKLRCSCSNMVGYGT